VAKVPLCFFVMPFRPDLNYFYLYVRKYLQEKYRIRVERGDTNVVTKALMEKIREQIVESSVVIGDITGNSPNVFFELGFARCNWAADHIPYTRSSRERSCRYSPV
jgi:hypothetical protein